ncbi:MAG: 30S ribosomal protein S16 [Acidobacteriota bacterium]|nr:30S ribosomal protein S16 [Acidobacteriota bacterium]
MMSMRLTRIGSKNNPAYRIVVIDSEKPRESEAKEYIGTYNPTTEPAEVKIDVAKAQAWIAKGAKPSQTVQSLLTKALKKTKPA